MGCEQSTDKKGADDSPSKWAAKVQPTKTMEIDSEFRKEMRNSTSYQDVRQDGQNMSNPEENEVEILLEKYRQSEIKINVIEKSDPLTLFYIKQAHLTNIDEYLKEQLTRIEDCKEKDQLSREQREANEVKDTNVRQVLIELGDRKFNREEQDLLAVANKLEIAFTELEMLHQERAMLESDLVDLKSILEELKAEYHRQDDILSQLSLNKPGEDERVIQRNLAELETHRLRISDVYERWKEGRALVAEACRQFSLALRKWREITDDTPERHYELGDDIRDDLVTALQCLVSAKFYIKTDFPYCSKMEIEVLEKAMAYLFIDMKTMERRLHADNCYTAFQKRGVALFAWIDATIQTIIEPDITEISKAIHEQVVRLRRVRLDIIKGKFPQATWHDIDNDTNDGILFNDTQFPMTDTESEQVLNELDLGQLAPLPSKEEIFAQVADNIIENYKSRLQQSITTSAKRKSSVDKTVEEKSIERQDSLATQLRLLEEDIK